MVGLLLPAVQAAREAARRMQCSNNLKQIGLGIHNYESTYRQLPLNQGIVTAHQPSIASQVRTNSWLVGLLPFVEQPGLYEMYDFNYEPSNDPRNGSNLNAPNNPSNAFVARTIIPGYRCPSDGLSPERAPQANTALWKLASRTTKGSVARIGIKALHNERRRDRSRSVAVTLRAMGWIMETDALYGVTSRPLSSDSAIFSMV